MRHSFIKRNRTFYGAVIFTLASLFLVFEMALQVSPSIMTHELMKDFKIPASILGLMASFYFYSYTLMQIPGGLLFDRFGPRSLITIATLFCSFGALFFGISHSIYFLSLGRFFMGFGSAFAFVGVLTVAARWFKPALFAFFVGITQFLACIGAMGGAYPLSVAVDYFGWRETITSLAYFGFALCVLCALFIRNHPPEFDPHQHKHHLVPFKKRIFSILKEPQSWWLALYAFCSWGTVVVFAALWGVPYLMVYYNISNTQAALAISMIWIGGAFCSPVLGWLSDRMGKRNPILTLSALLGLVTSCLILYVPHLPLSAAFVILLLFGAASSGQILTFAVAKDIHCHSIVSTAMGFNNMAVVLGGATLQPLVGFIMTALSRKTASGKLIEYGVFEYQASLSLVPICYLIALLVSIFFIKETYCKSKNETIVDLYE